MFGKKNNSNKGMAMVTTIIIVALIAVLSGSLMQMAYLSYSRKIVERRSNETFYTAEACLDTIKTAVQNSVASSIPVAKEGQLEFAKSAFAVLAKMDLNTVTGTSSVSITKSHPLYTYLYNKLIYEDDEHTTLKTDEKIYNGYNLSAGDTPTTIKDAIDPAKYGGDFTIGEMKVEATGVRIKDVYIKVVNKQGYVAEIKTDIVINAPIYAEDIEVPTGSYSMFAGNGAKFYGSSDPAYVHQEGNVYVGYYQDDDGNNTNISFEVTSSSGCLMYALISFGGTNVIFNGDVYIDNGNSMIFSGGDGKENCNIQVNGYIYLKDAASLLLPPNANLVCRGIMEWDATLSKYVPYTGNGNNNTTLSQFYPMTETYMDGKTGYSNFINDTDGVDYSIYDLLKVSGKEIKSGEYDRSWFDPRIKSVGINNDRGVGVYILDAEHDSAKGFYNRQNDKYYLLKGNYNEATKTMSFSPADSTATGVYDGQISCRPADTKLNIKEKVTYNGKSYDSEFAKIINVQVLDLYSDYDGNKLLDYQYEGFDPTNPATFKEYTWKGGIPTGTKDAFGNDIVTSVKEILKMVPNAENLIVNKINWGQMRQSSDPEDEKQDNDPLLGDRIFRAPNNVNTSPTKLANSVSTDMHFATDIYLPNSTTPLSYTAAASNCAVGNIGGSLNINDSGNGFYIMISTDTLKVKVPEVYTGIFLSADRVEFYGKNGYSSGVSIIEAGKHAVADGYINKEGLKDAGNPVRKILLKFSSCMLGGNRSKWDDKGVSQNSNIAGLNILDGLFAGGIQSMWSTGETISGGGSGSNQNAGNFVDNDNWTKNPTP